MLSNKLFSSIGNTDRLYVDDVFSAYTYTGNDSTQTINSGIDLAGKGGLVWIKERSSSRDHSLYDTARGVTSKLLSNLTNGNYLADTEVTAFNSNGYSLGTSPQTNGTAQTYVSWTFRKAPKFFDVVTYTGNGAASRSIAHSLGIAPGMLIVKRTDAAGIWYAFHKYDETKYSMLNGTDGFYAFGSSRQFASDSFSVGGINTNGASYVAYLFAHDPSADGIVQCGSYVANGSASGPIINLGWEPQYVMIKRTVGGTGNWILLDSMRGMPVGGNDATLCANSSGAENGVLIGNLISPTATGFQITDTSPEVNGSASDTYIYLAIRRPNKPPTTGTQVYKNVLQDGNNVELRSITGVGFAADMLIHSARQYANGSALLTRLTNKNIWTCYMNAEFGLSPSGTVFTMDGIYYDTTGVFNSSGLTVNHFFRRAPGFFDVVCYTGNNGAVPHGLSVAPELIFFKDRNPGAAPRGNLFVYSKLLGKNKALALNLSDSEKTVLNCFGNTLPSGDVFYTGVDGDGWQTGSVGQPYVAYLFASLPGISKVGSYTGNGSSQTINCGFSTGARFILIKRTDSTGDWYVWDTARGIIAANDPHLSLNTASAEVTTNDSVDPDSTGFIVNQVAATNINVTSSTYLYLAIA